MPSPEACVIFSQFLRSACRNLMEGRTCTSIGDNIFICVLTHSNVPTNLGCPQHSTVHTPHLNPRPDVIWTFMLHLSPVCRTWVAFPKPHPSHFVLSCFVNRTHFQYLWDPSRKGAAAGMMLAAWHRQLTHIHTGRLLAA